MRKYTHIFVTVSPSPLVLLFLGFFVSPCSLLYRIHVKYLCLCIIGGNYSRHSFSCVIPIFRYDFMASLYVWDDSVEWRSLHENKVLSRLAKDLFSFLYSSWYSLSLFPPTLLLPIPSLFFCLQPKVLILHSSLNSLFLPILFLVIPSHSPPNRSAQRWL